MSNDFDKHAKNYDTVFTFSEIGKAQRERVYHFLNKELLNDKPLSILEVNCGTGADARCFSEKGHRVIATDISSEMIEVAKKKHKNSSVVFQELDITRLNKDAFLEKFDLIFSNFGGLNCLSPNQVKEFISQTKDLLNPNGKIALVIMPRHCIWEKLYFLFKREFQKINRRNTNDFIIANVAGNEVKTWYYNPSKIKLFAEELFKTILVKPIGIKLPPSYLESFFSNKKIWLKLLIQGEKWLPYSIWAPYSDHFLILLEKK